MAFGDITITLGSDVDVAAIVRAFRELRDVAQHASEAVRDAAIDYQHARLVAGVLWPWAPAPNPKPRLAQQRYPLVETEETR